MKRLSIALICVALISCLFSACGSAAPMRSSAASSVASSSVEYYPEMAASAAGDSAYYDSGDGNGDYKYGVNSDNESAIPLPILTPSAANGKKMIYTVSLGLQTTDFRAGMRKLLDTVGEMGGYVESANVNGRDLRRPETERSAGYTFRVPSERLAEFLVIVEDNYNLLSLHQESQDYTAKYDHADTRLTDLAEQEKRLLEDLEKVTDTAEKLSLERRLAEVQASISGLNASQSATDASVLYSTVSVSLYEVILQQESEPELSFGERLNKTVAGSINGFVSFCQGLLLVVITIAPIALILFIVAAVALLIVRFIKKLRRKKSDANVENAKIEPGVENNK